MAGKEALAKFKTGAAKETAKEAAPAKPSVKATPAATEVEEGEEVVAEVMKKRTEKVGVGLEARDKMCVCVYVYVCVCV